MTAPPGPAASARATELAGEEAALTSTAPMDGDVLVVRQLVKTYRMGDVEVHALRGIEFSLRRGELLVLLGASGSGKSTLLNIIGGLDVPTSGTVTYEGQDLSQATDGELTEYRRRHIGFVFQFYNLIASLTAAENVALVTDISDSSIPALEALALVGLADRADHFPSQLSGGEQQRVAIARAIAKRPNILLCDEPTGALDYKTGVAVLKVLDDVNRQLGTSTAIITHNAPVAQMADRIVTLADGNIVSRRTNAARKSPRDVVW